MGPMGSMGLVYFTAHSVDFYGKFVDKYMDLLWEILKNPPSMCAASPPVHLFPAVFLVREIEELGCLGQSRRLRDAMVLEGLLTPCSIHPCFII